MRILSQIIITCKLSILSGLQMQPRFDEWACCDSQSTWYRGMYSKMAECAAISMQRVQENLYPNLSPTAPAHDVNGVENDYPLRFFPKMVSHKQRKFITIAFQVWSILRTLKEKQLHLRLVSLYIFLLSLIVQFVLLQYLYATTYTDIYLKFIGLFFSL